MQLFGVICFALAIPVSAILAERAAAVPAGHHRGHRALRLVLAPLLSSGTAAPC